MEQTAMQFFISQIDQRIENVKNSGELDAHSTTILTTLKVLRADAMLCLLTEKSQIVKAVNDTYDTCQVLEYGKMPTSIDGVNYYEQIYTQGVSQSNS